MKEIYVLSGLGADERAFQSIDFPDFKINFIKWVSPEANEPIEHYAIKLVTQIYSRRPILLGLSFGGMMAVEISKLIDTEKTILISSAKTKNEIPIYLRWAGFLGLNRIIPAALLKKPTFINHWLFGITDEKEKELLKAILADTDPVYLKWAVDKIVNWKNEYVPKNLVHIHGTVDKLLPLVQCDFPIKGGGHWMVLNKAEDISKLLRTILN